MDRHHRAARLARLAVIASCVLALAACGDDDGDTSPDTGPPMPDATMPDLSVPDSGPPDEDSGPTEDSGPGDDMGPTDDAGPVEMCMASAVPCEDQSFEMLDLFDTPTDAVITEEGATPGERTHIDTTGGGLMPSESYVYARFTEAGLEKLEISDEDAFASLDWDLAFRRFVIRLNSGVSGPSCVLAGRTGPSTTFEGLTAVPDSISYRTEEYFIGDACEYVSDGAGIGSPGTALSSFWSYAGCVQMTGNVYVVQLRSGRHVKLEVLSYYETEAQEECDATGMAPMPSGAGNLRIRWAFLD